MTGFFTKDSVSDWSTAKLSDTELYGRFFRNMLESGVYLAPSQFECAFVSMAHDEEHIEKTIEAAKLSMSALK